jgi:hypothetical protein
MKKLLFSIGLAVLGSCLFAGNLRAVEAKTYQVTGPVLEITDTYIVVQKGDDKWQIACDKNTTAANIKVGDKVTIHYQMVAKNVELKSDKAKPEKAEKPGKSGGHEKNQ